MSILSANALVDVLRDSQLLPSAQLDQLTPQLLSQYEDPQAFAKLLVQKGWLTPYQVDKVFQGQGQELIFGPYRLLELLGEGGMGQVFKAWHQPLNRLVALKVIRRERLIGYDEAVKRFRREAKAAAQLSHPNVVMIHDYDAIGDTHFIAMEFVEGVDLAKLVKEYGPLPIHQACSYIRQAAQGLQHAHERGMVHRDIKPSNLLVTVPTPPAGKPGRGISGFHARPILGGVGKTASLPKPPPSEEPKAEAEIGLVKILDMGLARLRSTAENERTDSSLTREGTVMGTPDYIAPEQARNAHTVDVRADLYSLGCTFYFLLTARPPFPEGSTIEKLLMHQLDNPRPVDKVRPAVPPGVAMILNKLMAKRPEDRYQTPAAVVEALAALRIAERATAIPATQEAFETTDPPSTDFVQVAVDQKPPVKEFDQIVVHDPAKNIAKLKNGHKGTVTALAWSPNRNMLASGGLDGTVRLEDFSGNKPVIWSVLKSHQGEVHSLAFSPDSKVLASGSGTVDGTVWLWDLSNVKPIEKAALRRHKAAVEALAFSPDGKMMATAGADGTIRLWDTTRDDNRERFLLRGHMGEVRSVAFSPDGKRLASGGVDGTVRLWTVGWIWSKEQAMLQGHRGQVNTVAFSPDGKTLASGSLDQNIRLWDLSEITPHPKAVLEGHNNVVRQLLFTPDGKMLVSVADGGQVILWQAATETILHQWNVSDSMLCSASFTFDGRYLALGFNDGLVSVFRLAAKKGSK